MSPSGVRLLTLQLRYPRFIHSELMTHRVFSRNAASSRAIPVKKMLEQVLTDPAGFVHIGANRPGMQAHEEVDDATKLQFLAERAELAEITAEYVRRWSEDYGIHKQVANRHLEPWQWMETVVTATEWDNFWHLRCHKDAMPEMRTLAERMHAAVEASSPAVLEPGEWHLPYLTEHIDDGPTRIKLSVARCARVSFLKHDKSDPLITEDLALHDKLVVRLPGDDNPEHMSPAEHQATPDMAGTLDGHYVNPELHGNLRGWVQYRKLVEQKLCVERYCS